MIMQEHDDNRFVKEKSDVEVYLMRVIQRYFDIENNYTQATIESIIVESIRRFKQDIYDETGFIFSINNKTGHIFLTMHDLGGENAFGKNTAYNKDFGTVADTICAGNDKRLSNKRKPLEHTHDIGDIDTLRETLDGFVAKLKKVHYHGNMTALDMLTYSGASIQIDLAVIDEIISKVQNYHSSLQISKSNLWVDYNNIFDILGRALYSVKANLEAAKKFITESKIWVESSKKTITENVQDFKDEILKRLDHYVKAEDVQNLDTFMGKVFTMVGSGEIPMPDSTLSFLFEEDTSHVYTETVNNEKAGNTIITSATSAAALLDSGEKARMFFRYDSGGKVQTVPLPFIFQTSDGFGLVQGYRDDDGRMYVSAEMKSIVRGKITASNIYDDNTIIFASAVYKNVYHQVDSQIKEQGCTVCVATDEKRNFIKSILPDKAKEYYVQAFKDSTETEWYYYDNNQEVALPYTDSTFASGSGNYVCIDGDGNLHRRDGVSVKAGYVAEYKPQKLYSYFTNPRIYYEVFKEGV